MHALSLSAAQRVAEAAISCRPIARRRRMHRRQRSVGRTDRDGANGRRAAAVRRDRPQQGVHRRLVQRPADPRVVAGDRRRSGAGARHHPHASAGGLRRRRSGPASTARWSVPSECRGARPIRIGRSPRRPHRQSSLVTTHLRQVWDRGETALGAFLFLREPLIAEAAALAGYDYVCIDMQHGLQSYRAHGHDALRDGPHRDARRSCECRGTSRASSAECSTPARTA